MAAELKLPEAARKRIYEARQAAIAANTVIEKYDAMIRTALDMLGVDPSVNPEVDFETGVITLPPTPLKPELVKDEAAS